LTQDAKGARILVVDDEPAIVRAVSTNLLRRGFQIDTANTGAAALDSYAARHPDLVLLDLGLPDMDGLEVVRQVRARSNTPIVVLSVRSREQDKVAALDLGADDYLTKPFGMDELLARVRVALRHAAHPSSGAAALFITGDLEVNLEQRTVHVAGGVVHLSPTEYGLLKAFIENPNKLLTNRHLLQEVWGPEYGSEEHYLHVYIARLRKKLETGETGHRYLITEPGVGYRLMAPEY
jgi:two-component system KDP operon response regulator KdpE